VASFANPNEPLRLGLVVGEPSGDLLAANLLNTLRERGIHFTVEGILGPRSQKVSGNNGRSLFPMETLSVMGIGEIFARLPQLICVRRRLFQHFLAHPPHLFLGVDAPEFNLGLEEKLKKHGILTAHYVSPSVWAWRQGRLKKIARAVDLMLTLFPFEEQFYKQHQIPVVYVGHTLADEIPLELNQNAAREALALPTDKATLIALLPGSRTNELNYLASAFIETAYRCAQKNTSFIFVAAMVDEERAQQFKKIYTEMGATVPIKITIGKAQQTMIAADIVLCASGTATLEALLLKKPMVVAYRMSKLSYFIIRRLIKTPYIALPNILLKKKYVPECIQSQATPEHLTMALLNTLNDSPKIAQLKKDFHALHQQLRCHASEKAADALLGLLAQKKE
jgi:lipid-A-disaccharide synthase